MIIVTPDLRLLGLAMRSYSVSGLVNGLSRAEARCLHPRRCLRRGLMFGSKAGLYADNRWFWIKIALLMLIAASYLTFRRGVYDGGRAKLAGGLSLLLWTGVLWAGRGPATVKDIMHSMVDPSGDFLFKSVQEIADDRGVREKAPQTDAEWEDVRQRFLVLVEAQALVTASGRMAARPKDRSKNPQC